MNRLYYGDNLEVLRNAREFPDECIDLIYLDPPFNSHRSYSVLFKSKSGDEAQAQIEAFDDTWTWSQESEGLYDAMVMEGGAPHTVTVALRAMRTLLGENDMLAYLVMMTARIVELHRVLKPTGSLYLHCDPTASHYLKVMLDAVFGAQNFRGEVTWLRTTTHNDAKRWSPNADIILYYGKSSAVTWNPVHLPHTTQYVESKYRFRDPDGRRYRLDNMTSPNPRPNMMYEWKGHASPPAGWRYKIETMERLDSEGRIWYPDSKAKRPQLKRYLDEQDGPVAGNVWTDIPPINSRAAERLGYPTQKPLALLERIIEASSNPGDVVLDPFCGCGTTIDAAQKLGRRWVGIDITYLSIDLMQKRLTATYGTDIDGTYEVRGVPRDIEAAHALFNADKLHFDFERWAVSLVNGQPKERTGGDRGVDGWIRFPTSKTEEGVAIVSVKGGQSTQRDWVQKLVGAVSEHDAQMGVLVCLAPPTRGMIDAANKSGSYVYELSGHSYPRVQIITIAELLAGKRPNMPTPLPAYKRARPRRGQGQLSMLD